MANLLAQVEQGRCPADDFADQVVDHGLAPAVSQLVKGAW
jgi:glutamate--cysteine ligase